MNKKLVKTLICSAIGIGSLMFQVSANAGQNISNDSQTISSNFLAGIFEQLPSLILPTHTQAESPTMANKSSLHSRPAQPKLTLYKMAGPSGMFRRVINAPGAGGRLNTSKKINPVSTKGKMTLSANVSSGMSLQSKDFQWTISSANKGISITKKGKNISTLLPPGKYKVRLTVGNTVLSETLALSSKGKKVTFKIKSGRLKASVSFAGGASVKASWKVYSMKGGSRSKKVYGPKTSSSINHTLAPGEYQIVASVGRVVKKKTITITSGKTKKTSIQLTGSKVKLMATKADLKSPLLKKTTWIIKNAATDQTVLTKKKHSATITLPPGKYIATATSSGVTKKKTFVVKPGRTSKIMLAME